VSLPPDALLIDRAIAWALARLGSIDYLCKCLAFVEDAYELANAIVLDGYPSAKEAADGYGAAENPGPPPRGALACYDCWGEIGGERRNWGHVGLALGDGRVVHAWGAVRVDGYLAIQDLANAPGWTAPRYIGWAALERALVGARMR
jgi:hypothetical protein